MARTGRELTDAQWAKLAPLLPPQRPRRGRRPNDHRLIVEAIMWLDRTGVPWRDLPGEFGSTRYDKHQANDLAMVTIAAIVPLWLE